MTIIEPSKNKFYLNEFLYIGALLVLSAILSIYFYNLNVNLKYEISLQERAIQKMEVANADLRNQLYQILDSRNLTAFIQEHNLISDKNPDYLENRILANR